MGNNLRLRFIVLFLIAWVVFFEFLLAVSTGNCTRNSSLVGFRSDFVMIQHQLRGIFEVMDDCSFRISRFDMLEGSDVCWWNALGDDFSKMTLGFEISFDKLNRTYRNDSFIVHLKENITWDQIKVVSVWDKSTYSDFGHIDLGDTMNISDVAMPPSYLPVDESIYAQSTMFDNCKILSPHYRVRWTLNLDNNSIDIGLEAAVDSQYYMAFGWADPGSSSSFMLHSDIVVTGFKEEGAPFADDYFITKYSECLLGQGVCPDTIYGGSDSVGLVNNTKLIYGHRHDGVSFIRYQRPLKSVDEKYDIAIDKNANMTVIWALGSIKPSDPPQSYFPLPQNHGRSMFVDYGYLKINVSENIDECLGPLEAKNKEDQDLLVADEKSPLIVTAKPALRYPNPPNPSKVLYINNREAPVLRVERGVSFTFSIQAGHGVALYITSDPIGGNATSRNKSETIYAGGSDYQGVPASPKQLVWSPDRNTPDEVYYQSFFGEKMGWKVQVVDGGLSDMYHNSVVLDDQRVKFFWTLSDNSISIAVRGEKKSGYLAVGFGGGMVNSFVYVGWFNSDGTGRVSSYFIDGKDALSVHPTSENLTNVRCKSENGLITFEFSRSLNFLCKGSPECRNIIDPTTPLRVIWAMGAQWSEEHLTERNMHSASSNRPVRVLLLRGSAEAEQDLRPVLAAHGFMMFVAWGILLPGGILAARYLKHVKGDGWYRIHVYIQYSGLAIVLLGVLYAAAELRGFSFASVHVKFGVISICLACFQPVNACLRPKKSSNSEETSSGRVLWEYLHVIVGRGAIVFGIASLISGMKHLEDRYGDENAKDLNWALMVWFVLGAVLVSYLEYKEMNKNRCSRGPGGGTWVLGNDDDDDSMDLLHANGTSVVQNPHSSGRMEVQLEPLNR